jgi:hypothetical protein
METVAVEKLLPDKFEPLRVNRWIMMLEGVDAFLVKTVEPPVIEPGTSSSQTLEIALYNVVGGDQNERLKAWLELPTSKDGELKFLDPVGTVVERWTFRARPLKMWFDKLDYASANLLATHLLVDVHNFKIVTG